MFFVISFSVILLWERENAAQFLPAKKTNYTLENTDYSYDFIDSLVELARNKQIGKYANKHSNIRNSLNSMKFCRSGKR